MRSLTDVEKAEIAVLYARGEETQMSLAIRYDTSISTVKNSCKKYLKYVLEDMTRNDIVWSSNGRIPRRKDQ